MGKRKKDKKNTIDKYYKSAVAKIKRKKLERDYAVQVDVKCPNCRHRYKMVKLLERFKRLVGFVVCPNCKMSFKMGYKKALGWYFPTRFKI